MHATVYPGREIQIPDIGVVVVVYPVAFRHFRRFTDHIASIIATLSTSLTPRAGESDQEYGARVLAQLLPLVMEDTTEFLQDCVEIRQPGAGENGAPVITLDDLPHWHIPPILEAWIDQSFGEEMKWRPWLVALEKMLTRATGKPISISETFSKLWSSRGTGGRTSSSAAEMAARIEAGASPSSTSGPSEPAEASTE